MLDNVNGLPASENKENKEKGKYCEQISALCTCHVMLSDLQACIFIAYKNRDYHNSLTRKYCGGGNMFFRHILSRTEERCKK